ncbi:glycosyltransferase [Clostridium sp. C8-1-8]|uniref:glycosyltransferase n=1 Tax=Clostridium sp. C8-1-8 TaxID=2698831 RepID=UPI00136A093F|nr:glycosyltransferase [Clostridium sp. C8-1-8]
MVKYRKGDDWKIFKKVIFFGWQTQSNFNAVFPILEGLLRKNVKIDYFGFKEYKKNVEDLGIEFHEYLNIDEILKWVYESNVKDYEVEEVIKNSCEFKERLLYMFKEMAEYNYNEILQIKPDIIFRDYSAINGKIVSGMLGKKTVGVNCLITLPNAEVRKNPIKLYGLFNSVNLEKVIPIEGSNFYEEIIKRHIEISKKLGITYINPVSIVDGEDDINICFGGNLVQPEVMGGDKEYLIAKPILKNMYPDGVEDERINEFLHSDKKLIYLATGSMIKAKNSFYNLVINAIKKTDYNLIISIPNIKKSYKVELPKNVVVRSNLNQQEILRRCDLFITAGGYNSICESISNLVPMLVNPLINDQMYNAYKIEELGIGKHINENEISKDEFIQCINELISNKFYKDNLLKVKENFEKSLSIDEILDYVISKI